MPDDQKQPFLDMIREELEYRVGSRLSEGVAKEQLEKFEKLMDDEDSAGAMAWLDTHRPDYRQVVADELEKLKQQITTYQDKILSS